MSLKRVVVVEGEDAAPEAMRPSVALLERMGLPIDWLRPGLDEARAAIDASDATLFGATSGARARVLFHLRWGRGTYANLRPVRFLRGARSPLARPDGLDLAIVRENLEDLYVGIEGELASLAGLPWRSRIDGRAPAELGAGRFALKVITEAGSERVARFAFEVARRRRAAGRPGRVTCGTKHNMLVQTDGLFRDVAARVAREFPDVGFEVRIVDDLAHRLVAHAHDLDVVLLPNLYGDILSDAAAALVGGLGLAPSGCYGDDYAYFEPAHGTAPDIAGRNVINPTATLLSAALMLEYLGFADAARRLERAIDATYEEGTALTPDQGGSASTTELCAAIEKCL
jgi:isocitrate/isopropylmalate dehydrogenase